MQALAPVACAPNIPNHLKSNKPLAIRQPTQHPLQPIHPAPLSPLPPYTLKTPQFKAHHPVGTDFTHDTVFNHGIIENHHHHHQEMERSPTSEGPLSHNWDRSQSHEDEDYIPWQEEMRRVEAARFRRHLLELRRTRQQEQKRVEKAKEWVWVVDEEMEVQEVQEVEVNSKVSFGERVKGAWRKVFSGKRRLSADELPLAKDRVMIRKLTVNF